MYHSKAFQSGFKAGNSANELIYLIVISEVGQRHCGSCAFLALFYQINHGRVSRPYRQSSPDFLQDARYEYLFGPIDHKSEDFITRIMKLV